MVVLVYLHGRLWRGAGLGLTAAVLVGFNQNLLLRMQEATPSTLVVCAILAALLGYGWHERMAVNQVALGHGLDQPSGRSLRGSLLVWLFFLWVDWPLLPFPS